MGHLVAAYTTQLAKDWIVSVKYAVNFYSNESDLAWGLQFVPSGKDIALNFKVSIKEVCFSF